MKIRILGNSIRYRLTRPEVSTLWEKGVLKEQTEFVEGKLAYAIESTELDQLTIRFINNNILLDIPKFMVEELYTTDKVGFQHTSGLVSILIEKDFACLDNNAEDQLDKFPNPNMTC